ncbi:MAG: energy-coupling factor transporter ATPase [Lachnospiraceae bacterium]|nr:energy-coupling factor transporter ATPase [Lachnospiraceae bacterium]
MENIVNTENIKYQYTKHDSEGNVIDTVNALDGVSVNVEAGSFIAVLGGNGSGKSTFAKHLNALLVPKEGTVYIDKMNTTDDSLKFDIRKTAGMVFQNPDNQIVASVVDEEVGFGPENIGVPTEEIWVRVEKALKDVGMYAYKDSSPNRLSGGQKQRVAIAGILAMEPKCIILDEPTAMLDPKGRKDVLKILHELNREKGVTIILITHYMEEVTDVDHVFVMEKGRVVLDGSPRFIFSNIDTIKQLRLDVPVAASLAHKLKSEGIDLQDGIITEGELIDAIENIIR